MVNHALYQKVIIDSIDATGYEENPKTAKEKVQFLKNRFDSEYGWRAKQVGQRKAMTDWLQGLAINIPFYNVDIIKLAKKGGSLPANATERQEDLILENYWDFMGNEVFKLFRKYNVN